MNTFSPVSDIVESNLLSRFESLLLDDQEMQKLRQAAQSQPKNIFSIICRDSDELTFSRTLKYFLDPSEDHSRGTEVLRSFLHAIISTDDAHYRSKGISRLEIDLLPLQNCIVYQEYVIGEFGRLDIYVEIPNELALLIEVKLYSAEGEGQTVCYTKWASERCRGYKNVLCAFLTPEGIKAESDSFTSISFAELHRAMEPHSRSLDPRNHLLYENFLNWIKVFMPTDPKLITLCRSIYKSYKKEIDLILTNIPSFKVFYEDMSKYVNASQTEILADSGNSWICFSPQSWMKTKELAVAKKFSLPRIQYNLTPNNQQSLVLCFPGKGDMHEKIKAKSKELFGKDAIEASEGSLPPFTGNVYWKLAPSEEVIIENLDKTWKEEFQRFAKHAIDEATRIESILTPEYLLGQ